MGSYGSGYSLGSPSSPRPSLPPLRRIAKQLITLIAESHLVLARLKVTGAQTVISRIGKNETPICLAQISHIKTFRKLGEFYFAEIKSYMISG